MLILMGRKYLQFHTQKFCLYTCTIFLRLQAAFVGCMLHISRTPSSVCVILYLVGYESMSQFVKILVRFISYENR